MARNQRIAQEQIEKPVAKMHKPVIADTTFKSFDKFQTETKQRSSASLNNFSPREIIQLQRVAGNRAVNTLIGRTNFPSPFIQTKLSVSASGDRYEHGVDRIGQEFETKLDPVQTQVAAQHKQTKTKHNKTGLPVKLKSGIENLSGYSMDDVQVHFNSLQPASYGAHAFAKGNDIHLAPGKESSLPHEAWHIVQQKQGRVQANLEMNHRLINADTSLELEADDMGRKAVVHAPNRPDFFAKPTISPTTHRKEAVMQMDWYEKVGEEIIKRKGTKPGGYKIVKVGGKFLKHEGESVYETAEQRQTHVIVPKSRAETLEDLGLPKAGEFNVDSSLVRFSQDTIGNKFTSGASIYDTVTSLNSGNVKFSDLPTIRIFRSKKDTLVTLDNRRLWCCQQAGVQVKCKWATVEEIKREGYKFTSGKGQEGKTTIEVRG